MPEKTADCHHNGHGPHPDDEECSCACHSADISLGIRQLSDLPLHCQHDDHDPWTPCDPDEGQGVQALLAYWKQANESPSAQKELVADQWRLWRFARDAATALDDLL